MLLHDTVDMGFFSFEKCRGKFARVIYQKASLAKKEFNISAFSLTSASYCFHNHVEWETRWPISYFDEKYKNVYGQTNWLMIIVSKGTQTNPSE